MHKFKKINLDKIDELSMNIISYIFLVASLYFLYAAYVSADLPEIPRKTVLFLTSPIGGFLVSLLLFLIFRGALIIKKTQMALDRFNELYDANYSNKE